MGQSRPHAPVDEAVEEIKALGRRAIGITADAIGLEAEAAVDITGGADTTVSAGGASARSDTALASRRGSR